MSNKQDVIEVRGVIEELLPSTKFRVRLENEQVIIAYLAGKLRKNHIRLVVGDEVQVAITPYDLTQGRITFRF